MLNKLKGFFVGLGVIGTIMFTVLMIFAGGIALHYDVSFWANYFHHPVHGNASLFWIVCLLAGFWIGPLAITVALVTLLLSFVI